MNKETHELLDSLGFAGFGIDPEARDHQLYAPATGVPMISVPSAGCSAAHVVSIIFHSGATAARKELRALHQDFINALTR